MVDKKEFVILTKAGDFYINQQQARAIGKAINEREFVTLNNAIVNTKTIDGILSWQEYQKRAQLKRLNWKCRHGAIHGWNETCRCGRQHNPPALPSGFKHQPTLQTEAIAEFTRKCLKTGDHEALKSKSKRLEFIAQYKANKNSENSNAGGSNSHDRTKDE